LTQGDTPWNPSTFTDQVVDVFDTESSNANIMKLIPYDASDIYENSIIGKPAILSCCPKLIMKVQDSQTLSTNTVPNYSKALPSSTDYETFVKLDSGEDIPKEYQKFPYHIVFDVKYDLSQKARLVADGSFIGKELKFVKSPMNEGCFIWMIVLGRLDNAFAIHAMSRFNMAPREGHLKSVKKISAYLKTFSKGRSSLISFIQIVLSTL
jgi:hypothetical protein